MKTHMLPSKELSQHSNFSHWPAPGNAIGRRWVAACGLCLLLLAARTAPAQSLYWDGNSLVTGAGATPAGGWDSSLFWTLDPNGETLTGAWVPGSTAVFSAG